MKHWRLRSLLQNHRERLAIHQLHERLEAEGCNLSYPHLTRIVDGKFELIRLEIIVALCRALDCTADDLICVDQKLRGIRPTTFVTAATGSGQRPKAIDKIGGIRPIGSRIRGS